MKIELKLNGDGWLLIASGFGMALSALVMIREAEIIDAVKMAASFIVQTILFVSTAQQIAIKAQLEAMRKDID